MISKSCWRLWTASIIHTYTNTQRVVCTGITQTKSSIPADVLLKRDNTVQSHSLYLTHVQLHILSNNHWKKKRTAVSMGPSRKLRGDEVPYPSITALALPSPDGHIAMLHGRFSFKIHTICLLNTSQLSSVCWRYSIPYKIHTGDLKDS